MDRETGKIRIAPLHLGARRRPTDQPDRRRKPDRGRNHPGTGAHAGRRDAVRSARRPLPQRQFPRSQAADDARLRSARDRGVVVPTRARSGRTAPRAWARTPCHPGMAAVANAIYNATGIRLRAVPFTRAAILRRWVSRGRRRPHGIRSWLPALAGLGGVGRVLSDPPQGLRCPRRSDDVNNFSYSRPATLRDAARSLARNTERSTLLAGGTDLLGEMKDDLRRAREARRDQAPHGAAGDPARVRRACASVRPRCSSTSSRVRGRAEANAAARDGRRENLARRRSATWRRSAATCASARAAGISGTTIPATSTAATRASR